MICLDSRMNAKGCVAFDEKDNSSGTEVNALTPVPDCCF